MPIRRLISLALLLTACTDASTGGGGAPDVGASLRDALPLDMVPDITGATCRLNSDCIPGLYCRGGTCTFDCRVDRDCPRGTSCQSGECQSDDPPPPPELDDGIPTLDAQPDVDDGIDPDGMPPRLDRGMPPRPDAMPMPDMAPPDMALPPVGRQPLGSDCERAFHCESDLCVDVAVQGVAHAICASPCCGERDCPLGFGCQYLNGIKLCVPSRIYPPGYTFDRAAGQPCAGNACQSGLCDVRADRCLGACCVDADCGGRLCVWTPTGAGPRGICDIPLGFGRTGDGCFSEFDCQSQVCVPHPAAPGGAPGICADVCCTHRDCPGGTTCGRVAAYDGASISGVISACVPVAPGPQPDGSACGSDDVCAGLDCIEDVCTRPCCHDGDCAAGLRCLPRPTREGIFARVCVVPDPPE